ncbi:hypothetical protein ACDT14_13590, partial [Staphylococcus aureus]
PGRIRAVGRGVGLRQYFELSSRQTSKEGLVFKDELDAMREDMRQALRQELREELRQELGKSLGRSLHLWDFSTLKHRVTIPVLLGM